MPSSGLSSAALAATADFSVGEAPPGGVAPRRMASARSLTIASSSRLSPEALISCFSARAQKPPPTPAVAPAAAPSPNPQSAVNACMTRNLQTHQAELEALGKRAEAAQAAGDTERLIAIADTLQQLQMAGCGGR